MEKKNGILAILQDRTVNVLRTEEASDSSDNEHLSTKIVRSTHNNRVDSSSSTSNVFHTVNVLSTKDPSDSSDNEPLSKKMGLSMSS